MFLELSFRSATFCGSSQTKDAPAAHASKEQCESTIFLLVLPPVSGEPGSRHRLAISMPLACFMMASLTAFDSVYLPLEPETVGSSSNLLYSTELQCALVRSWQLGNCSILLQLVVQRALHKPHLNSVLWR